jgi:hypothetical protein
VKRVIEAGRGARVRTHSRWLMPQRSLRMHDNTISAGMNPTPPDVSEQDSTAHTFGGGVGVNMTPASVSEVLVAPEATAVPIGAIRIDGDKQPRVKIDDATVADYVTDLKAGAEFPAVDVFFDGTDHWLADGFHRLHAHSQAGRETIRAVVHEGTQSDAQWLGYAANRDHGLRRTNADKERAVRAALKHPHGMNLSDGAIAAHVGVTDKTVAKHRSMATPEIPESSVRTGRDGRAIAVAKIGKRSRKSKSKSMPPTVPQTATAPAFDPTPAAAPEDGAVRHQPASRSPHAPVTDENGRVIESEELMAAFALRTDFKSLMSEVSGLKGKFRYLARLSGGWAVRHQQEFDAVVGNLHAVLRFSMPYAVCPYCGGAKCPKCKDTGWMPEEVFRNVPSDDRGGK